ncbi:MAG TPA: YhhA family cyclophane-containing RiPP [Frankiaceae bacterium]|nr:YhhA family cyclophane-containing RiPP [Frankiaceae bacterium]
MDTTVPELAAEATTNIAEELTASRPAHAALSRLHDDLVGGAPAEEITSYDRLHHRHNRS